MDYRQESHRQRGLFANDSSSNASLWPFSMLQARDILGGSRLSVSNKLKSPSYTESNKAGEMSILGNLYQTRALNSNNPEFIRLFGGVVSTSAGVDVTPQSALAHAAVYACIKILSEVLASLPRHLIQRTEQGKQVNDVHNVSQLLSRSGQANDLITSSEFVGVMQGWAALRGNAFAEIETRGGRPTALFPIHPDNVTINHMDNRTVSYTIQTKSGSQILPMSRIFHLRGQSLGDGVVGLSPIAASRETFGRVLATNQFSGAFYANGMFPSGIVEFPRKLDKESKQLLAEQIASAHGGSANAGKTPIFDNGMTWKSVGINAEDAQMIEVMKFGVEEVARIFRIPLHLLQSLDSMTFNNVEQLGIDFVTYGLMPWITRWEDAINRSLLTAAERTILFMRFNVNALLRGDIKTRSEFYTNGIMAGWLEPNEVRDLEDLNAREDAEGLRTQLNMGLSSNLNSEPEEVSTNV